MTSSMHRTTVVMICVFLLSCQHGSDRSNAQEANDDKFGHHKEKEANFVIDILDTSYGLIDLAKFGEARIDDPQQKAKVQMVVQRHTTDRKFIKGHQHQLVSLCNSAATRYF